MKRTINSAQLDAFAEVAKTRHFSLAAKNLHITQSALSQRIQNLESELATGLIIRDSVGLRLTPAGEELLRYCHVKQSLEIEVLGKISTSQTGHRGQVRIGGFSSVMRSVAMPALEGLVASKPSCNIEIFCREIPDLFGMLQSNEVDMILTTVESNRQDIETKHIGEELYVLVESSRLTAARHDVYLDHDPSDTFTQSFLALNGQKLKGRRNYLDEVYSIVDGVKRGWGRAVLPVHLIRHEKDLKVVKKLKPLRVPVMLQHFRLPYYSQLFTQTQAEIVKNAPLILKETR